MSLCGKGPKYKQNMRLHLHFCTMRPQFASFELFSKEICWSSRKSVILRRQLNKNIKLTMLQRRMNNCNIVSDRGIKCLERLSCVHTSGIGAFYTFGDIFRRTSDRPSGIRWCWYPAERKMKTVGESLPNFSTVFVWCLLVTFARCALLRQFRPRAEL